MKIKDFYDLIDRFAPFELSRKMCEAEGCYDNSGIMIDTDDDIVGVTFALDFSAATVERAISDGSNLIITHHPAIYHGIESVGGAYVTAIKNGIGVISAHLNLDCAKEGVDQCFANMLGAGAGSGFFSGLFGAGRCELTLDFGHGTGYGRRFAADTTLGEFANAAVDNLKTQCFVFGDKQKRIKSVASFCGAGLSEKEIDAVDADVYCSSDIAHHVIKYALEKGKAVLQFTHYASEKWGIINLYRHFCGLKEIINNDIKLYFFDDERFF